MFLLNLHNIYIFDVKNKFWQYRLLLELRMGLALSIFLLEQSFGSGTLFCLPQALSAAWLVNTGPGEFKKS